MSPNGFNFRPATRASIRLLLGLSGGTGSGKTYSAMRLAKGLGGEKRFAVIDTENGRASMYADYFQFDVVNLDSPFTPDRYLEAIIAAEKAGYSVILVDSMSHEWAGEGGILDMQEEELYRMAKDDYSKREACKMASWVKPKMAHKSFVAHLLQVNAHVILCFRAEPKIEMVKKDGKMVVQPKQTLTGLDGWVPICEKNLPYELTASFLLTADRPGVPQPIKLQEQHKPYFPLGKPITEDAGRLIGEWARGGTVAKPETITPRLPITETKPGVYEPEGQPAGKPPAAWFKEIAESPSIEALKRTGVELAKLSSLDADSFATCRELYAARMKQLKKPRPSPELPEGAGPVKGAEPAPQAAGVKPEEPWI